ncbi:ParB/RepB/Spo0J family partition protein [Pseudothauera nasutitermitis]|uniref:ParB/RepB/Spo0J family partition protein n=1 Tax=Pseudothauera nasutitermitis TaxID=2565930 RepID=A0A4V3WB09_9RHOO|nr:ParB/RepB/Spo0J family partition protein [Pseudothauera nasutitermitis]THF61435.1 ParB/RepB/Spo0J family partition protein [Pseudothauera nasutitermitis]
MSTEFLHISLGLLAPSPTNPRKTFADLEDLAESIKAQGVMQPILARPWPSDYPTPANRGAAPAYEIVAGERRYRASLLAGLDELPVLVRDLDTRAVLEAQIVENLQRRDVTELEEAEGYQLMMRDHGYTADELAEKVGKSRAYIYGRLKLCALCDECRQLYRDGKLDASRALLIARIPVPALQVKAAEAIIRDGWPHGPMSAREAANHIQQHYMLDLLKAPFPMSAHIVVQSTGILGTRAFGEIPCTECPQRTGNAPDEYPGISPDVCTDPTCYAAKRAAHMAKQVETEKAMGRKVITGEAAKKIAPHGIYSHEHGDYIALDEKSYYGGEYKTARKAIKGQDVPIVMIEDHRKGALVPMVAKKDLNEALRANGIKISNSSRDPKDLARERARKIEIQYRRTLFEQHHASARMAINAAKKPELKHADLALVARQFWAQRGSDAQKRLARMYVPEAPERTEQDSQWQDDDWRRGRRLSAMIDEFNDAQLILFLLDLALVGTLDVPTYMDDIATPEPLLAAAQRAGLDPDAIRADLGTKTPAGTSTAPQAAPAPAPEVSAPKFTIGDRVRGRADACWDNGEPINIGQEPGTITAHAADGYAVAFDDGTRRTYLPASALETLPAEASEPASTPTQAAPAASDTGQAKASDKPPRAKKAAPARGATAAKPKKQAATAAKKSTGKAKTSGRASPAGGKKARAGDDAEAAPYRCPKTMDMLEGATA